MATPVLASTSKAAASTGSSVVVAKPSGTASGDYLYALVTLIDNASNVITPPAGWTVLHSDAYVYFGTYPSRTTLYRKVAGGSEPSTYTWSASNPLSLIAIAYLVTGADSENSVSLVTTTGNTYPFPSITTTVDDSLVLLAGVSPAAATGEWAQTVPSGTTGATTNEASIGLAHFTQVSLGATGIKSTTQAAALSSGNPGIAYTVAIAPPSGPPTLTTLTLSATVAHNAPNGTVAGTVSGRRAGSTLTLTDDAGGAFAIDSATGNITKAGALSYLSSPYSITVRETLTGATNTPKDTVLSVTVTRGYVGPKWLGVGTVASGTGNITPALPASMAVGERMVLIAESANQAIAAPSGWTEVTGSPQGTGTAAGTAATRLAGFTRVYQAGDAAPTITDPGDHCIARIHRFEASTLGETSGNVAATASTSGTMPGVTTTADDALIVLCASVATDIATARFSAWTNAALANLTERSDDATTQGNGGGIGLTTGEKITAGATGTTSFTVATSSVQGRLTFALYTPSGGGGTDALTASPITTPAPIIGSPSVAQRHALTAAAIVAAAAVIGNPTLSQQHALTAIEISSPAASIGSPALSQAVALTASPIITPAPVIGSPSISQVHDLSAQAVVTPGANIGTPTVTQTHALTATGITAPAAVVGSPVIGQAVALTATAITAPAATVGSPAIAQRHVLTATNVTTPAPSIGAPGIAQRHTLTAVALVTGAPTIGTPALAASGDLVAVNIVSPAPQIGSPALSQRHALTATVITGVAPVIGSPTLTQAVTLTAVGITAPAPSVGSPTVNQVITLQGVSITAGAPTIGFADFGQVHAFATVDLVAPGATIGSPVIGDPFVPSVVPSQRVIRSEIENRAASGPDERRGASADPENRVSAADDATRSASADEQRRGASADVQIRGSSYGV